MELKLSGLLNPSASTNGNKKEKYYPPPEAIKIPTGHTFIVFKDDKPIEQIHLSSGDHVIFGNKKPPSHILLAHESCSREHAVVQGRRIKRSPFASDVVSCLLDLGSANGTWLNEKQIDALRFYELKEGDVVRFGASTRRYVFMVK